MFVILAVVALLDMSPTPVWAAGLILDQGNSMSLGSGKLDLGC